MTGEGRHWDESEPPKQKDKLFFFFLLHDHCVFAVETLNNQKLEMKWSDSVPRLPRDI